MILGIVGSEAAKFTRLGEIRALLVLRNLIARPVVTKVVSGRCHLGGIDLWAIQVARDCGKETEEFPPKNQDWNTGYKPRNVRIARVSDEVHCITVDVLPPNFSGMVFDLCYHCKTKDHVKSGGCWTMKKAIELGKVGRLHIVPNGPSKILTQ